MLKIKEIQIGCCCRSPVARYQTWALQPTSARPGSTLGLTSWGLEGKLPSW